MNTRITLWREIGLVAVVVAALFLSFGAASIASANSDEWNDMNDDSDGSIYETSMTGSKEVPSVSTSSVSGYSGVWFGDNGSGMNYWLEVYNGDEVTAAHLHCADSDENGPVVVTLFSDSSGRDVNGNLSSGDINDGSIASTGDDCDDTIGYAIDNVDELAQAIEDGDIYVNVHTEEHPAGAARGQLAFRENTNDNDGDDGNNGNDGDNDNGNNDDDDNNGHDGDKDHDMCRVDNEDNDHGSKNDLNNNDERDWNDDNDHHSSHNDNSDDHDSKDRSGSLAERIMSHVFSRFGMER